MDKETAARLALDRREQLIRWVGRRLGPAAKRRLDAASVVDSVLKSLCRLKEVPDTEQGLESLLWVMTRWKLAKRLREGFAARRDARKDVPLTDAGNPVLPGASPEEEAVMNELEEKFEEWKQALPENVRAIIDLTEKDVPLQEIAYRLGISDRTVRRHLAQAEEQLRRFLGV